MDYKIKGNYAYGVACLTSMGVRITPVGSQPVHTSSLFEMRSTSAESNVVNVASSLGYKGLVLTKFVKDNVITHFIKSELRKRNIAYEGAEVDAGGPWGYRHQINITDSGFGVRGARVQNDRAGEVGRTLSISEFDILRIFGKKGVAILHISGIFAALSHETGVFCVEMAKAAKRYGTLVSFDLNFRASFWEGHEAELRRVFTDIADLADVLVGNEEDFQLALGIEGPEAGGKGLASKIGGFKEMITRIQKEFPNAALIGTTLRQVLSANRNMWGAIAAAKDQVFVEEPREIDILDRIGGGDGFTGGLLYGVLKGWEPERCMQFGWACGALATTMIEDYITPMDEDQVWSVYRGNARVRR